MVRLTSWLRQVIAPPAVGSGAEILSSNPGFGLGLNASSLEQKTIDYLSFFSKDIGLIIFL